MLLTSMAICGAAAHAVASSHREAPAIAEDPLADNTDVYVFISPSDSDRLVIMANYVPLMLPASGPNFYGFSNNVAYEIRVDNDGDARSDITYRFKFRTDILNGDTFLYNLGPVSSVFDPALNVRQFYDLERIDDVQQTRTMIAQNVPVAPANVGRNSFPGGYESVAQQVIRTAPLPGGGAALLFVGPRDDPFFVDLGGIFDGLAPEGDAALSGLNVMSIVLELPITDLAAGGVRPGSEETGPTSIIGIYARALRRRIKLFSRSQGSRDFGRDVQVSRLGLPLINEVVLPLNLKDAFNRSDPADDLDNIGSYLLFPLLPELLGICPPTPPGGRTDLVDMLSPNGTTPADMLRINITEGQTFAHSRFLNGRTLEDDVTDTLLTLICSGDSSVPIDDGVDANDIPFSSSFPYLGVPHEGNP